VARMRVHVHTAPMRGRARGLPAARITGVCRVAAAKVTGVCRIAAAAKIGSVKIRSASNLAEDP
jgi:cytoskeletal protein CcmA (bactofilin family)